MAALFVFRIASRRWSAQHTCRLLGLRRLCTHSGDNLRRRNAEEVLVKIGEALHESPEFAPLIVKKLGPSTSKGIVEAWTALQGNVCRGISLPKEPVPPKWSQLGRLAGLAAVPMVGFGFADNFVMLLAGDYIDATLCYRLNLSTLFAAGLGNVISDVAGLATAGPIETAARKMGIKGHGLTPRQMGTWTAMSAKYLGSALGLIIGCIIGMFPLLWPKEKRFWPSREDLEEEEETNDHKDNK